MIGSTEVQWLALANSQLQEAVQIRSSVWVGVFLCGACSHRRSLGSGAVKLWVYCECSRARADLFFALVLFSGQSKDLEQVLFQWEGSEHTSEGANVNFLWTLRAHRDYAPIFRCLSVKQNSTKNPQISISPSCKCLLILRVASETVAVPMDPSHLWARTNCHRNRFGDSLMVARGRGSDFRRKSRRKRWKCGVCEWGPDYQKSKYGWN